MVNYFKIVSSLKICIKLTVGYKKEMRIFYFCHLSGLASGELVFRSCFKNWSFLFRQLLDNDT